MSITADILMITCRRPHYTRASVARLLDAMPGDARVWIWQNGPDAATVDVLRSFESHPRLHQLILSPTNEMLRGPVNWFFEHADAPFLGLLNDDCAVDATWLSTLRGALEETPELGVVGGWHYHPDDFDEDTARHKIMTLASGRRLLVHPWVQGSGVLVRRACVEQQGPLRADEHGLTGYWLRLAAAGWINGWPIPFTYVDHMDDPRSEFTQLRTDADLADHLPLSARTRGVRTIADWLAHLKLSARIIQTAPAEVRTYLGWRKRWRRLMTRLRREPLYY